MTAEILSNLFAGCKIPVKEMEKMITEFSEAVVKEIATEIKKECTEYHRGHGMIVYGTSWAQICRTLRKYGFTDTKPF
jgi:hypothetical protein